uniref:Uncharacterized protein n=1 Tax=Anguilla anguilla TaxID=7936 RepID=A0A0E9UX89_ANGAN
MALDLIRILTPPISLQLNCQLYFKAMMLVLLT